MSVWWNTTVPYGHSFGAADLHSFLYFPYIHVQVKKTKDVEMVVINIKVSVRITDVKCLNTIIVQ
jgi:hypothetical protein